MANKKKSQHGYTPLQKYFSSTRPQGFRNRHLTEEKEMFSSILCCPSIQSSLMTPPLGGMVIHKEEWSSFLLWILAAPLKVGQSLSFEQPWGLQRDERKSFKPPFLLCCLFSSIRIFLRRAKGDDFALPGFDDDELVFEDADLGVPLGVLSITDFGVDLLADCGVLCLPALPGVLRFLDKVVKISRFIPGCLDTLLQVWHIAIRALEALLNFWRTAVCSALSLFPADSLFRSLLIVAVGFRLGRRRTWWLPSCRHWKQKGQIIDTGRADPMLWCLCMRKRDCSGQMSL